MADAKTPREEVIELIERDRGLLGRPMTEDGFRMPLQGETALVYQANTRIRWETSRENGRRPDPVVCFEIHENERLTDEPDVSKLDPRLAAYLRDAKFELQKHGLVTCITGDGPVLHPLVFRVEPAFPEETWEDPAKAAERLATLRAIREQGRKLHTYRLTVAWSSFERALHSNKPEMFPEQPPGPGANFLQRRGKGDQLELVLARLPGGWKHTKPDANGMLELRADQAGMAVLISPAAIANLRAVITKVTLEHMAFLQEAYYGKR
jgi:hypothetical protein